VIQTKWFKFLRCNNGFQLPASQAKFLDYCESKILSSTSLRETFVNKLNNEIYKVNSIIKRPKLAKTLDIIARDGESAFYNGQLTDTIVEEIQSNGGIINKSDLQSYECLVKEPITLKLRNNIELNTVPSPGCGILLNFIMGILDGKFFFLFLKVIFLIYKLKIKMKYFRTSEALYFTVLI
jgi:gamma-glutamyltranspeptidase/glutathione hydrolase/leukotriene-C4 hydrolase